jgi:transcriptional regulator with XRE-family HTH domain
MRRAELRLTLMSKPAEPEQLLRERLRAIKHGMNGVVADAAGVDRATLSRWKNWDETSEPLNPDLAALKGIAKALGITLAELFREPGEPGESDQRVAEALRKLDEARALLGEVSSARERTPPQPAPVSSRARGGAERTVPARKGRTRAKRTEG